MTLTSLTVLDGWLERRLAGRAQAFFADAVAECAAGPTSGRFGEILALASRHVRPTEALAPSDGERDEASAALSGWEPERWTLLETLRARLAIGLAEAGGEPADATLEEAFRYADEGETAALMRSAAHLPRAERFRWRVGEGCRSNMRTVFEAAACDTPYLERYFDDESFRQAALKALFVGAPLWRIRGLDQHLDATLARMALDYIEERRSAGRHVPHEVWLCLGPHGGDRGIQSLAAELRAETRHSIPGAPEHHGARARAAAGLALLRTGASEHFQTYLASEADSRVRRVWSDQSGAFPAQGVFRALELAAFSNL